MALITEPTRVATWPPTCNRQANKKIDRITTLPRHSTVYFCSALDTQLESQSGGCVPSLLVARTTLFCGSDGGGETAVAIYSLLGTRLNRVEPELWLREVLTRIAEHPLSRIEDLLPWNLAAHLQPRTA